MRRTDGPASWLPASLALALLLPGSAAAVDIDGPPDLHDGGTAAHFVGRVWKIPPGVADAMVGSSWRPGCPVPIGKLRLLTLTHWGYEGEVRQGRLIVRRGQGQAVLWVMRRLFNSGFPIKRMKLVDRYDGSDLRSMNANNTSAFNCRTATGDSDTWSQHAYGTAIDINPVQNPYVSSGGQVLPPKGKPFVDRSKKHPGMIRAGGVVVQAFSQIGWEWGGSWSSTKDYQHFSLTGH